MTAKTGILRSEGVMREPDPIARGAGLAGPGDPGFAVYVHWPFCLAKCPYCDFNSHVRHRPVDEDRFARALLAELCWFAAEAPGERVRSIFFGGGTPSLMAPSTVGAVLSAIERHWGFADGIEITLEANPTSVEAGRFAGYRAAGVNRVSLGVQALDDEALARLGRRHTAAEALAAFAVARGTFARASFDLIYARPGHQPDAWAGELSRALALEPEHLSLYQLTIEPGTRYFDLHRAGRLAVPDDEAAAALYRLTQEMCEAAGLPAYEISNHAAPGAECRHNLVYWQAGRWAGIGPGAHSRLAMDGGALRALATERHPERWLERVEANATGVADDAPLSPREAADELLLMSLRTSLGLDLARHAALGGAIDRARLDTLLADGFVELSGEGARLRLTAPGRLVANAVITELASG
jgi:oxygen-independent coproporphyrinogen-3 oxidase